MPGHLGSRYHLPAVVLAVEFAVVAVGGAVVRIESVDVVCDAVFDEMLVGTVSDDSNEPRFHAKLHSSKFEGNRGRSRRRVFASVSAAANAVVSCPWPVASLSMQLPQWPLFVPSGG